MHAALRTLEPGLLKIVFPHENGVNIYQELALKVHPLAELPNDILCFRPWLRNFMKDRDLFGDSAYPGQFPGYSVADKYILSVNGRTIFLDGGYHERNNLNMLLIPCNSPFFDIAREGIDDALLEAGFNRARSTWDQYKAWEAEHLKTFK